MAENLCNNVKAQVSLEGRTFKDPCGFFGCNYSNFQDWLFTLKSRIDLANSNWKKLNSIIQLPNTKNLNDAENAYGGRIQEAKELYNILKDKPDGLSGIEYEKFIGQLKTGISEITCLIEEIQISIEDRDGKIVATGLTDQRQEGLMSSVAKWVMIGAAGYLAFTFVNQRVKK